MKTYLITIILYYYYCGSRTLIPCILAIARSGRKALRVRIVLKAWIPLAPNKAATKFIRDTCVK